VIRLANRESILHRTWQELKNHLHASLAEMIQRHRLTHLTDAVALWSEVRLLAGRLIDEDNPPAQPHGAGR
jgi:hypothetical protein